MKLIGIDLNSSQQLRSSICRYSLLLYGVFLLSLVSGHGIYKGLKIFGVFSKNSEAYPYSKSLTLERTIELYYITYITYNLATHVLLMAVTAVKWKELWQTLQQIEEQFLLDNNHFQQCRKVVIIGLSMLALVTSFFFFLISSISKGSFFLSLYRIQFLVTSEVGGFFQTELIINPGSLPSTAFFFY